jgi:arsenate reductase
MEEVGIDISEYVSKTTSELPKIEFDYVITLCSHADANCPFFPEKTKKIHIGFDDPAKLGKGLLDDEKLVVFARIRDQIRCMIVSLPELIN